MPTLQETQLLKQKSNHFSVATHVCALLGTSPLGFENLQVHLVLFLSVRTDTRHLLFSSLTLLSLVAFPRLGFQSVLCVVMPRAAPVAIGTAILPSWISYITD